MVPGSALRRVTGEGEGVDTGREVLYLIRGLDGVKMSSGWEFGKKGPLFAHRATPDRQTEIYNVKFANHLTVT